MPGGRPRFQPTEKQRGQVEAMARYGIPQAEMARTLGIGKTTLEKHFAEELATGATKANAQVGEFLFSTIVGLAIPNRAPVTDGRARVSAGIFWAKTRMGWRETSVHEHTGKDGGPIKTENAQHFISAALDKIAARLAGNAPGDDPKDAS
jgi:hypothetical protein